MQETNISMSAGQPKEGLKLPKNLH